LALQYTAERREAKQTKLSQVRAHEWEEAGKVPGQIGAEAGEHVLQVETDGHTKDGQQQG
jgi:hypothetical protein